MGERWLLRPTHVDPEYYLRRLPDEALNVLADNSRANMLSLMRFHDAVQREMTRRHGSNPNNVA